MCRRERERERERGEGENLEGGIEWLGGLL